MTTLHNEHQQYYLYRFFNAAGRLLYVGISNNPDRRWDEHADDKPWWGEVADQTSERAGDMHDALALEEDAIHRERPLYNVVHNGDNPDRVAWRPEKGHRGRDIRLPALRVRLGVVLWTALSVTITVQAIRVDFPYGWQFAALAAVFALFCARPRSTRRRSRRRRRHWPKALS